MTARLVERERPRHVGRQLKHSSLSSVPVTDLSNPFRVLCEKQLQCVKLLGNTLDVIQTINTNNDFHPPETLLQLRYAIFYRLFL